jgi:hypothetical protein
MSRTAVVAAWVVRPPRSRMLKAARAELSAIAQDWLWTRLEIIGEQDRRRLPVERRRLVVHLPLCDLSCRPQPPRAFSSSSLVLRVTSRRFLGVPVAGSSPTRCESQLLGDRGDRTSVPLSAKKDQRSSDNVKLRATTGQISAAGGENKKIIEQGQRV